jgi:uncharacterized protein (TIGR00297 family)
VIGFLSRVALGVALAATVAYVGVRARSLTRGGAIMATLVGTAAVAAGWNWAALLIIYFAVSTLLSRQGADRKRSRIAGIIEKPGARDSLQVLANGFPFVACTVLGLLRPGDITFWMIAGAGSLAASAADTWATEIGTMVGQRPRSIVTWRPMIVGESGGVSAAGSAGSVAGALFIAFVATALMRFEIKGFLLVFVGGIAGAVADSVAGALLQRRSWCDVCDQGTEMRIHDCGTTTRQTGGIARLENDGVNLIATATGALVPALVRLFS